MANPQNLIPGGHIPSREEASKGGKRSGETRRKKKLFRESILMVLGSQISDDEAKRRLAAIGMPETVLSEINFQVARKATAGDVEAARFLRDSIGEKPTDALQLSADGPVRAMDLVGKTDAELAELADQMDSGDNR